MGRIQPEEKNEQKEKTVGGKSKALESNCENEELNGKPMDEKKNLKEMSERNAALIARKKEVEGENAQLKKVQSLFMDWAMQQEWELPPQIRDLLPKDPVLMRKAALGRVPHGRSPAEYTFNLLYFLALSEKEQEELGSKIFHREKMIRPEDTAELEIVIHELHELLFYFPDADVKMDVQYGYLSGCEPKYSVDPNSDWVKLKKLAVNLFDVYTRVVVESEVNRGYGHTDPKMLTLSAKRKIKSGWQKGKTKSYRINAAYNKETGNFVLKETVHSWEIINYGMVDYHGHYIVSNLVMDNNPPYNVGNKGTVQIVWKGTCIYDTSED